MRRVLITHTDLQRMFESAITVRDIAEPLVSFDAERNSADVKSFLDNHKFDVAGVRRDGRVCGYVCRERLKKERLDDCLEFFTSKQVVSESESLIMALQKLTDQTLHCLFVTAFGKVGGIVTRADLQKSPVTMWLFGLISLIEMQMLRLIRDYYPTEAWKRLVYSNHLKEAENHFRRRKANNQEIDLAACLSLSAKAEIFKNDRQLKELLCRSDLKDDSAFFKNLVKLRDDLAHPQNIIDNHWPQLPALAQDAEKLLSKLESARTPVS